MSGGNFSNGAGYLVEGFRLLNKPSIRPFVIIPLLINILIFASLWFYTVQELTHWMDQFIAWLPQWLSFLNYLLWPLLIAGMLLLSGYLFSSVAIFIASPFNALLAEKAEELISGREVPGLEGIGAAFAAIPRSLAREVSKLVYYLPRLLGVLILSLIPPFNLFAPLLWFGFGAWMMSIQYCDYPMDNHQLSFADVRRSVGENRLTSLGFGGVVSIMAGIPLLNFFVVPAAVCGATIFWHRELSRRNTP